MRREGAPGADRARKGLKVSRVFTQDRDGRPVEPESTVSWELRSTCIRGADGSVVFESDGVEVPEAWSTVAGDVMASKYMRKAGVSESVIMEITGHSTRTMFDRYNTVDLEDTRQATRQL